MGTWLFVDSCLFVQQLCVGFYQLSRLRALVKDGYPRWVFLWMHGMGILLFFNISPLMLICDRCLRTECGLTGANHDFHVEYASLFSVQQDAALYVVWSHVYLVLCVSWDLITVLLYVLKIYKVTASIKSAGSAVQQRLDDVHLSLQRVLLLTVSHTLALLIVFFIRYYSISSVSVEWREVVFMAVAIPLSMIFAMSMYLMQEHNTKEYTSFLKLVIIFKLHWVCCAWRHTVPRQLAVYSIEAELKKHIDGEATNTRSASKSSERAGDETPNDIFVGSGTANGDGTERKMEESQTEPHIAVSVLSGTNDTKTSTTTTSRTTTLEIQQHRIENREFWNNLRGDS